MTAGALHRALRGELDGWTGLPPELAAADVVGLEVDAREPGLGRLSGMPVRFVYDQAAGVTAWLDDHDRVFLVWADRPGGGEPVTLGQLEALGEPDAKLADRPSRIPGTQQWVWASRGLTLYVRAWEEHPAEVRALALFAPSSVEYYEAWLGADEGPPYRPRRDGPG